MNLAQLILTGPDILLLDEPINHIDIVTREILEEVLQEYSGTLLFISHNRYFINKLANRQLVIKDDTIHKM